ARQPDRQRHRLSHLSAEARCPPELPLILLNSRSVPPQKHYPCNHPASRGTYQRRAGRPSGETNPRSPRRSRPRTARSGAAPHINGRRIMKAFLATLCLLACGGMASANIHGSGTGKVTYVPDIGHVTVGVSSDGKTAQEAWAKNRDLVKKIFEALARQGIDAKDMQTGNVNIQPKYNRPEKGEPQLVGYAVSYE